MVEKNDKNTSHIIQHDAKEHSETKLKSKIIDKNLGNTKISNLTTSDRKSLMDSFKTSFLQLALLEPEKHLNDQQKDLIKKTIEGYENGKCSEKMKAFIEMKLNMKKEIKDLTSELEKHNIEMMQKTTQIGQEVLSKQSAMIEIDKEILKLVRSKDQA
jgi:hypothetical protein